MRSEYEVSESVLGGTAAGQVEWTRKADRTMQHGAEIISSTRRGNRQTVREKIQDKSNKDSK